METAPEASGLHNAATLRPGRAGFRVPFGLRDGRAWAPVEVKKGRACGCICPGCLAPLSAKAQASRRRRPHFAHLVNSVCTTGRETGIHLRAKQLIAERQRLLLPPWDGALPRMPNPPMAQDDSGEWHRGRRVEVPSRIAALWDIHLERSFGAYTPDVSAIDNLGSLLIEIRVTHAVDDEKAARVGANRQRMVEIDLSHLDRFTPHDPAAFEHAVLSDPENRRWVVHPQASNDWDASKGELALHIAERNGWIAEQRRQSERAEQERRQRVAREERNKLEKKEFVRRRERSKHTRDLEQLFELTDPGRVNHSLEKYRKQSEARVDELLDGASLAVRSAVLRWHADAWVFGTHPALWQILAYKHFIAGRPAGERFNQREVASWVRRSFPSEASLYRLFVAQYVARAEARRAGFAKRSIGYWVFTPEENARIPDFYAPINDFISRIESTRLIRLLPTPIGECEVLPASPTGLYPAAVVAS